MSSATLTTQQDARRQARALWRNQPDDARRAILDRQRARHTADAADCRAHVGRILDAEHVARLDARRAELPDTPAWAASFWRAQLRPLMAGDLDHGDHERDMGERARPRHSPGEWERYYRAVPCPPNCWPSHTPA